MSDISDSGGEGTSQQPKKKMKYLQNYKEEWEHLPEFKNWISKSNKGPQFAKCKACDKHLNISSGKDAISKHGLSAFHEKKVKSIAKQSTLTVFAKAGLSSNANVEKQVKEGEIRLSAFVAEHNLPFLVMDHLVNVIAKVCPDSKIAQGLTCGRTKTTAIVKNVLGQHSFEDLCSKLRKSKFSLIVDESTDLSTSKHLCLIARYVSDNTVCDSFLTLIKICEADAITLHRHIIEFFQNNNIPFKDNLIGFASDGANVMMGARNSLMTLLTKDVPFLFVLKCICHSFHLCASYACQKLPRYVEDVTRDIYNYFGSSPKRVLEFAEFQNFCNIKVHKILHPSQTRWLSVHAAVTRILEQYNALKLFFVDAVDRNDILAAENILSRLNDPTTKLFLQFLEYVLPFFNHLNREMQSESPKIHLVHKNICNILRNLFDCFLKRNYLLSVPISNIDFKNPSNFLPVSEIYLGVNVQKTILESVLSEEQLTFFKLRCLDFYIEGCSQIIKRYPLKNNPIEKLCFMDPAIVKSGSLQSVSDVAMIFPNLINNSELQGLDTEWRLLRNVEEIQKFSDNIEEFWSQVKILKYGDDTFMFPILTNFICNLLILPHSSANVERIFSQVNLMKTKLRNKLKTSTISSLLHTKRYIGSDNCHSFEIEDKLVSSMNDKILYKDNLED